MSAVSYVLPPLPYPEKGRTFVRGFAPDDERLLAYGRECARVAMQANVNIPEAKPEYLANITDSEEAYAAGSAYVEGWNACRQEILDRVREACKAVPSSPEATGGGPWELASFEEGKRVDGLRTWQVRWLEDETPEQISGIANPGFTELPAEFKSGNDIPVTRATISRERMQEILEDAAGTSGALRAIKKAVELLGPTAPECSGCQYEWSEALKMLKGVLEGSPEEGEPQPIPTPSGPHPSHDLRSSDSSAYGFKCTKCGVTDVSGAGWGFLALPCQEGEQETSDG